MSIQHERRSGNDRRHYALSASVLSRMGNEKRWNRDPRRFFGDDDERYGPDWGDDREDGDGSLIDVQVSD